VQISGAWTGSVMLGMSPEVASAAAGVMFKISATECTDIDRQEVAAELANMIGGNIKSLLPGPSFLSLPTIMFGSNVDQMLDVELIEQSVFISKEGPIQVRLFAAT
jgi:chemotaxis protein CheX